ncbi:hypothetical protein HHK36_013397 [Tetracentron sinense]|uniref:Water stress and hypersensitive response domain-containing protein n=1 Tax=Tetracentron sinense TaxID=13715 RepID=A0A834ZEH8_TETSI|nr:hypothetical protein HHK36_013397 [Tetracentron sinense]
MMLGTTISTKDVEGNNLQLMQKKETPVSKEQGVLMLPLISINMIKMYKEEPTPENEYKIPTSLKLRCKAEEIMNQKEPTCHARSSLFPDMNANVANFLIYVHSKPGFVFDRSTMRLLFVETFQGLCVLKYRLLVYRSLYVVSFGVLNSNKVPSVASSNENAIAARVGDAINILATSRRKKKIQGSLKGPYIEKEGPSRANKYKEKDPMSLLGNPKRFNGMASSDKPEVVERDVKEKDHKEEDKEEESGGFIDKVKDFIHDIGEKIEEAIGFGKPTADVTGIHIPSINLDKVEIVVDVLVTNPNPIPIPLIDINYLIESDGRKLVSGLIPDAGTIHAHGSETVKIPVHLIYADIKNTYDDIKPGSIIPYKLKVDLIVDVPVFGRLTLPLEKTGEIPIPYEPDIDIEKIKFERFSLEETVAVLHLKLENKNDFDLGLNALDYEVWLSDVSIGGAELTKSTKIDKNGISYIDIPITFRPKDFGSALWDMIRGKGTGYTMKGHIDVDTPFGAMKLPISKEGGTTSFTKNKEDGGDDDDECMLFCVLLLLDFINNFEKETGPRYYCRISMIATDERSVAPKSTCSPDPSGTMQESAKALTAEADPGGILIREDFGRQGRSSNACKRLMLGRVCVDSLEQPEILPSNNLFQRGILCPTSMPNRFIADPSAHLATIASPTFHASASSNRLASCAFDLGFHAFGYECLNSKDEVTRSEAMGMEVPLDEEPEVQGGGQPSSSTGPSPVLPEILIREDFGRQGRSSNACKREISFEFLNSRSRAGFDSIRFNLSILVDVMGVRARRTYPLVEGKSRDYHQSLLRGNNRRSFPATTYFSVESFVLLLCLTASLLILPLILPPLPPPPFMLLLLPIGLLLVLMILAFMPLDMSA